MGGWVTADWLARRGACRVLRPAVGAASKRFDSDRPVALEARRLVRPGRLGAARAGTAGCHCGKRAGAGTGLTR
ncbi:hypothetical protein LJR269_006625 [Duganella sp. LjRoot269]